MTTLEGQVQGKGEKRVKWKKQQVSVYGGLRYIYVRTLFEKGGLIVLSAQLFK